MGSKKIIAVCQSGGKFQANKDGTLSYHGGEAYAVGLQEDAQLTEFKQDLAETFQCNVDDMLIKYFLPGNKKTLIGVSKDKDLRRMVDFFNDSDQVEVFVMSDKFDVGVNGSSLSASRSSRTTVSEEAIGAVVSTSDTIDPPDNVDMVISNESDPLNIVINETTAMGPSTSTNNGKHRKAATQWENTIIGVDQRFSNILEFRQALHKYSIAHGFTCTFKMNDPYRVSAKCKSEGCTWNIYASRIGNSQLVCIKKMNKSHTCDGGDVKVGCPSRVWVGSIVTEKLKVSPNYNPKDIVNDIEREYGIQLNYFQARRARETARKQLQGSYEEAYSQIPFFCEKIIETNPGSVATFTTKDDSSFHRFFVSFHASICGFQLGCRPLFFLDSVPLNSKYQGMLLGATAPDGDDGVFPVAFAVVDEETDENWRWFLMELKSVVVTSQQITFVANSQEVLRESLVEVFDGECYHGYSLSFLVEKLNKDLKGQLSRDARRLMVQDFYAAAYTPKVETFQQYADNIKAISPEAYIWVINSEPEHWANAFFKGERYNHFPSNFGQLFYSWVLDANVLPITQMFDVLRGKIMQLIYTRRVDSSQWVTRLTPTMEEKLNNEALKAYSFQVALAQGNTYEVQNEYVDIDNWSCTCKEWKLTGLPCCHAIAVFKWIGMDMYDYCSTYFTAESFRKMYAESIHPMPNIEIALKSESPELLITVTPPSTKRPPGRPKMKQAESVEIIKRPVQCSKCKGLGHNKRKCK